MNKNTSNWPEQFILWILKKFSVFFKSLLLLFECVPSRFWACPSRILRGEAFERWLGLESSPRVNAIRLLVKCATFFVLPCEDSVGLLLHSVFCVRTQCSCLPEHRAFPSLPSSFLFPLSLLFIYLKDRPYRGESVLPSAGLIWPRPSHLVHLKGE